MLEVVYFYLGFVLSVSERMEEERECVSAPKELTNSSCSLAVEKAESCAVCRTKLSFSSEPKLLPCLHIMCKACSVNTSVDNNAKGKPHVRVIDTDS